MEPVTGFTAYHAKYLAHELIRQIPPYEKGRLAMSLFDSQVDLNPHQIEASLFALRSPLSRGVILADEVGLGKTIEAALVMCQLWAERKRKIQIIAPASIRKQWVNELESKFYLPARVVDRREYQNMQRAGETLNGFIPVVSYQFASRNADMLAFEPWNLVVMDEAHRLRNIYRGSSRIAANLQQAFKHCKKLLLTATPLQNTVEELYGLASIIDETLFGDLEAFRENYSGKEGDYNELRNRLSTFIKRTLRKDVLEYIQYTERKAITVPFSPGDREESLYQALSHFLQREDTFAIPSNQRHLILLVMRKIMASSSYALASSLEKLLSRLKHLQSTNTRSELTDLIEDESILNFV